MKQYIRPLSIIVVTVNGIIISIIIVIREEITAKTLAIYFCTLHFFLSIYISIYSIVISIISNDHLWPLFGWMRWIFERRFRIKKHLFKDVFIEDLRLIRMWYWFVLNKSVFVEGGSETVLWPFTPKSHESLFQMKSFASSFTWLLPCYHCYVFHSCRIIPTYSGLNVSSRMHRLAEAASL